METHIYSEFPGHLSVVHIALFTQVTNSSLIRERIRGATVSELASDREAVNFAFVNANLVRFPFVSRISLAHFDCSDHQHSTPQNRYLPSNYLCLTGVFANQDCPLGNLMGIEPD
jgi:hypothetical protein